MGLPAINTSLENYVVLDIETNGLKSKEHDLLSISFYKPDDGREYHRFLPLHLNSNIYTAEVNGITEQDIKGQNT